MAFIDDVIKGVRDWDADRPRSRQAAVGWSEVGGCRAYIGYRLDGAWASDETDNWAAIRGTAIHTFLEEVVGAGAGMHAEVTTSYRGIPGHADLLVDPTSVTDYKTKTLASSKNWQESPAAFRQARVQVHGYAAGLVDEGRLPADCTVRILVIPVDGKFTDWWAWEEPFDRSLADEGADRLEDVHRRVAAGEHLPKDKPYTWCKDWCPFFSMCRGGDDPLATEEITDPELSAAIASYGEANAVWSAADKVKKRIGPMIRGLRGTAGDWRITTGEDGEDGEQPDLEAIAAIFAERGEAVPMTVKPGRAGQLRVTKVKPKAPKSKPAGDAVPNA